jgi:hypothetical protein
MSAFIFWTATGGRWLTRCNASWTCGSTSPCIRFWGKSIASGACCYWHCIRRAMPLKLARSGAIRGFRKTEAQEPLRLTCPPAKRTCETMESTTCLLAFRILAVGPGFRIASQNITPPTESQTMLLSFKHYSCPMIAKFAPERTCTKVNKGKIVRSWDPVRGQRQIRARGGRNIRREPVRFGRSSRRCTTTGPSHDSLWNGNRARCRIPTRATLSRPA